MINLRWCTLWCLTILAAFSITSSCPLPLRYLYYSSTIRLLSTTFRRSRTFLQRNTVQVSIILDLCNARISGEDPFCCAFFFHPFSKNRCQPNHGIEDLWDRSYTPWLWRSNLGSCQWLQAPLSLHSCGSQMVEVTMGNHHPWKTHKKNAEIRQNFPLEGTLLALWWCHRLLLTDSEIIKHGRILKICPAIFGNSEVVEERVAREGGRHGPVPWQRCRTNQQKKESSIKIGS